MNTPQSLYAFTSKLILGKSGSIIIFPAWGTAVAFYCSFRTPDSFCGLSFAFPISSHFPWCTAFLWVPWTHQTHSYLRALPVAPSWTTAPPDVSIPVSFLFKFSRRSSHHCRPLDHPIQIAPFPLIRSYSPVFFSSMYLSQSALTLGICLQVYCLWSP